MSNKFLPRGSKNPSGFFLPVILVFSLAAAMTFSAGANYDAGEELVFSNGAHGNGNNLNDNVNAADKAGTGDGNAGSAAVEGRNDAPPDYLPDLPAADTRQAPPEQAVRKVAVVLFNFQNNQSQPYTREYARAMLFDTVSGYYAETSFGMLALAGKANPSGDVFGWYTVPYSNDNCDYNSWTAAARSAATQDGADFSGYDHVLYAFPYTKSCPWTGLSDLAGPGSWNNGRLTLGIVAHELGHNMGMDHSNTYRCFDGAARVAISDTCTTIPYTDPFDIMGSGTWSTNYAAHFNSFQKGSQGWLSPENTLTVTASGLYTVEPNEIRGSGIKSLRIPADKDSSGKQRFYYLEFRQPYGFDNYFRFTGASPVSNGVSIRLAPDYARGQHSLLIDTTPDTLTYEDAPLAVGRTFADSSKGISITPTSITPAGITVQVTVPQAPEDVTINIKHEPSSPTEGQTVTLKAGAAASSGIKEIVIFVDGAVKKTCAAAQCEFSSAFPAGTHNYAATTMSNAGKAGRAEGSFAVTTPAPTIYTLTAAKTGDGAIVSSPAGINCGSACSAGFAAGTIVALTAVPASGSVFAGWNGACSGTGTCPLAMSGSRSVTATFTATPTTQPPPAQTQCVRRNPGLALAPASQTGQSGQALRYTITLRNNDDSSCGPSTFAVVPSLASGLSQSPKWVSVSNVAPGTSISFRMSITATGKSGIYSFVQTAASSQAPSFRTSVKGTFVIA